MQAEENRLIDLRGSLERTKKAMSLVTNVPLLLPVGGFAIEGVLELLKCVCVCVVTVSSQIFFKSESFFAREKM